LRSYLPADHPDKADEIGSEPTPGEFIDSLLDVVEACARVVAAHGSMCFELGDTYSGSGGAGGDYGESGLREGQPKFRQGTPRWDGRPEGQIRTTTSDPVNARNGGGDGWPEAKSLALIPESFRWALAYGRNPFTGRETERWRVRNVIRWCRPNPPVGALGDKFRPGTSEMVVICKARDRYFDLDAVRVPGPCYDHALKYGKPGGAYSHDRGNTDRGDNGASQFLPHPAGAPPLDWWSIPTQGYPGAHYATWPKALLRRPILAMCPERVCRTCGQPSRRIVDVNYVTQPARPLRDDEARRYGSIDGKRANDHRATEHTTTGWTDCGCPGDDRWRPGVVLDPFAGSGTTAEVSLGLGRSSVSVDLDERNLDLAQDRLGMFPLEVVDHRTKAEAL